MGGCLNFDAGDGEMMRVGAASDAFAWEFVDLASHKKLQGSCSLLVSFHPFSFCYFYPKISNIDLQQCEPEILHEPSQDLNFLKKVKLHKHNTLAIALSQLELYILYILTNY